MYFLSNLPYKAKRKEEEGFSRVFSLQTYHTKPKENEFSNAFVP